MSADLAADQAGFVNNFAYGTISLTSNTSVELVDQSHNTSSTSFEAVYANEVIVPRGHAQPEQPPSLRAGRSDRGHDGGRDDRVVLGGSTRLERADSRHAHARRGHTTGRSTAPRANRSRSSSTPAVAATTRPSRPHWTGARWHCSARAAARWRRPPAVAPGRSRRSADSPSRPAAATRSRCRPPVAGVEHRQLRALGVRRHGDGPLLDGQSKRDRKDQQSLRPRSVGIHRLGRAAGAARRDRHQRRHPVRPDRPRQSNALLEHPVRLRLDHAAVEWELRTDRPRLGWPGGCLCLCRIRPR